MLYFFNSLDSSLNKLHLQFFHNFISQESLYSKDMRDIVIEVEKYKTYVIPFGYCQYYDISNTLYDANCSYEWNTDKKVLIIRALRNIEKGEKLCLKDKKNGLSIKRYGDNPKQCKIYSDGNSVYALKNIKKDDIIEICPVKIVDKGSLYTKDMQDIIFEIQKNAFYAIPFGYCQYYNIANDVNEADCDYIWDGNTEVIVIKALKNIKKGKKLYLNIVK